MPYRIHVCLWLIAWLPLLAVDQASGQVPLPDAVTLFDGTFQSQSITVSVDPINVVSVSGGVTLTISSATPGSAPDADVDATTSYAVTVNGSNKKLTGVLDAAYAAGITLQVLLAAPTGGSASQKTLGTSAQDLVTSITHRAESGLSITYTASATVAASPNGAGASRTVTFTLADM